jgi:hypothetical protein
MAPVPKNYKKIRELTYRHKPSRKTLVAKKERNGMYRLFLKDPKGDTIASGHGGANKEDTRSHMMDIMEKSPDGARTSDIV